MPDFFSLSPGLRIIHTSKPRQHRQIFEKFNAEAQTWVVSDLRTKTGLQQRWLSDHPFLPGDGVLRASEFWKKLLIRVSPNLSVISNDLALILISSWLDEISLEMNVQRNEEAPEKISAIGISRELQAKTVFSYLSQLIPVFSHPQHIEAMNEWFDLRPAAQERWQNWYELSSRIWDRFLSHGQIAAPWISGVICNQQLNSAFWNRPLVIDLGVELTSVEAEILNEISKYQSVTVLMPNPAWLADFPLALSSYQCFFKTAKP
jgi:hypothetical protein